MVSEIAVSADSVVERSYYLRNLAVAADIVTVEMKADIAQRYVKKIKSEQKQRFLVFQ